MHRTFPFMKLSKEAYKKAADELAFRKNVLGPKLAEQIYESAAQGDGIHDNVQLRDTRNEIQVNLDVIARLEDVIRSSDNLSETKSESVQIGSIVRILDLETQKTREVQVVDTESLNFVTNAVSDKSPIGLAIIGKSLNDKIQVTLPNGNLKEFQIIEFK